MPRKAKGYVLKPGGGRRSFGLRFWAYGNRETIKLGKPEDGWTLEMAERELAIVLRDVDLGTWRRPEPDPAPASDADPTFHEFASTWFESKRLEIEQNTASSYRNDLTNHLLPFFKDHHLSQITIAEVDRYRQRKVREAAEIEAAAAKGKPRMVEIVDRLGRRYFRRERPLFPRSINMHLFLLAQILDVAVDHGHLPSNPARGKRRRLKVSKPRPIHLEVPSTSRPCSKPRHNSTPARGRSLWRIAAAARIDEPTARRSAGGRRSRCCCWGAAGPPLRARCSGWTSIWPTAASWSGATNRGGDARGGNAPAAPRDPHRAQGRNDQAARAHGLR